MSRKFLEFLIFWIFKGAKIGGNFFGGLLLEITCHIFSFPSSWDLLFLSFLRKGRSNLANFINEKALPYSDGHSP